MTKTGRKLAGTSHRTMNCLALAMALLLVLGAMGCSEKRGDPKLFINYGHGSPDAPPVDIYIDEAHLVISDLQPGDITGYIENTWRPRSFTVTEAGTDRILIPATIPASTGDRGEQSVYVVGSIADGTLALLTYSQGKGDPDPGRVRFVGAHAAADVAQINLVVNSDKTNRNIHYLEGGSTVRAPDKEVEIRLETRDEQIKLFVRAYALQGERDYSVILNGELENGTLEMLLLEDEVGVLHDPIARLRPYHGAAELHDVKLEFIVDGEVADRNVNYDKRRDYVPLLPGSRRVIVRDAQTGEAVFDFGEIPLVSSGDVTAYVFSDADGVLLGGVADDPDIPGNDSTARIRILQVAPVGEDVDVFLEGELLFEDVPFGGVTEYVRVTSGSRQIRVDRSSGETLISKTFSLVRGEDFTVSLNGLLGGDPDLKLTRLEDDKR